MTSEQSVQSSTLGIKLKFWLAYTRLNTIKFLKNILNYTPMGLRKHFFYKYNFLYEPPQLAFLGNCIFETKDIQGAVIEIGCAEGMTTVFLRNYLKYYNIQKEYICIDTFSGFTKEDINYEARKRNKSKDALKTMFRINRKNWVDRTLKMNGMTDVRTCAGDINVINMKDINVQSISFALVDLDLYLPALSALEKCYPLLKQGGIIVVDDCVPHEFFDGAYQAYKEFCSKYGLKENIVEKRLGIIRK